MAGLRCSLPLVLHFVFELGCGQKLCYFRWLTSQTFFVYCIVSKYASKSDSPFIATDTNMPGMYILNWGLNWLGLLKIFCKFAHVLRHCLQNKNQTVVRTNTDVKNKNIFSTKALRPASTQHWLCGCWNSVERLSTSSAGWPLATCDQPVSGLLLVIVVTKFQCGLSV